MQCNLQHAGLPESARKALATFLEPWTKRTDLVGILLAGSYATDLANRFSDIDVYVVFADSSQTRERGNHVIDGWVVEYNADPIRYIRALQAEQHRMGIRHCARKMTTGKVILDCGELSALRAEAQVMMSKPFEPKDQVRVEMMKYYLWDQLDNLRDLSDRTAPGFMYAYHCGLQMLIGFYAEYLSAEVLRPVRVYEFLSDEVFRTKYGINELGDKEFMAMAAEAIAHPALARIETLTEYVQEKMGGFILDGWRLTVPA